jgi:hypothetical protein
MRIAGPLNRRYRLREPGPAYTNVYSFCTGQVVAICLQQLGLRGHARRKTFDGQMVIEMRGVAGPQITRGEEPDKKGIEVSRLVDVHAKHSP